MRLCDGTKERTTDVSNSKRRGVIAIIGTKARDFSSRSSFQIAADSERLQRVLSRDQVVRVSIECRLEYIYRTMVANMRKLVAKDTTTTVWRQSGIKSVKTNIQCYTHNPVNCV